jgi:hypothetical protein
VGLNSRSLFLALAVLPLIGSSIFSQNTTTIPSADSTDTTTTADDDLMRDIRTHASLLSNPELLNKLLADTNPVIEGTDLDKYFHDTDTTEPTTSEPH